MTLPRIHTVQFQPTGDEVTNQTLTGAYYEANDESQSPSFGHAINHLEAQTNLVQTVGSADTTISSMTGTSYILKFPGTNTTVTDARNAWIKSPNDNVGAGTTVNAYHGIDIEDLDGLGAQNYAIRIRAQSAEDGDEGNVKFDSGEFDGGHLQLHDSHLYVDQATDSVWLKEGSAPGSDTDGIRLNLGTGSSSHGVALWGASSSPFPFNTGNGVCGDAGLSCATIYDAGGGGPDDCGEDEHGFAKFIALCH